MSAVSQTAKNYRVLLKHVKALPSVENWKGRVVEQVYCAFTSLSAITTATKVFFPPFLLLLLVQYKAGRGITDPALAEHQRSVASQYVHMISSIKEISHLRGLDYGEKLDPRDKIRATASRVGLAVPRVRKLTHQVEIFHHKNYPFFPCCSFHSI